jgi:hypothetical protein
MAKRPNLAAVDLKNTGKSQPERDGDGKKAQTVRLSEEVLEGLRVRAALFKTTQASLVEQYVKEGFERHPVQPYRGL